MLHHYIIVRRDMPVGVVLAQVAHAAGESFYTFAQRHPDLRTARCASYYPDIAFPHSSGSEHRTFSPGVGSSQLPGGANADVAQTLTEHSGLTEGALQLQAAVGSTFDASRTVVVVLGARNENKLLRLASALRSADIAHVLIREVDGIFAGQVTAIGIEPSMRDRIAPHVKDFHMFPPSLLVPDLAAISDANKGA